MFDPAYSPNLDEVLALRRRFPLGVKVGPGIPYTALPSEAHAQWVSVDGAVVEAGLWFGPLSPGAGRSALLLGRDEEGRRTTNQLEWTGDADAPAPAAPSGPLNAYLYEPEAAVIRPGSLPRSRAISMVARGRWDRVFHLRHRHRLPVRHRVPRARCADFG